MSSTEAPLESLPINHPQAGYISPDLSFHDGHDEADLTEQEENAAARDAEAQAVAEHEDAVAKAEDEGAEIAPTKAAAKESGGSASKS